MNNKFIGYHCSKIYTFVTYSLVWELVQINYRNRILLSVLVNLLCLVIFTECVGILSEMCMTLILNQDYYIA